MAFAHGFYLTLTSVPIRPVPSPWRSLPDGEARWRHALRGGVLAPLVALLAWTGLAGAQTPPASVLENKPLGVQPAQSPAPVPSAAQGSASPEASAPGVKPGSALGKPLPVIPSEFEAWRDQEGFLWRLGRDGGLKSGESRFFNNAMTLVVNAKEFRSTAATIEEGGALGEGGVRLRLMGKAGDLGMTRDIWFDAERSGLRYLDRIQNTGAQPLTLNVVYDLSFNYQWENIHTLDGRIFTPGIVDAGAGLVVHFDQAGDGQPDLVLLSNSDKGAASVGTVNLAGSGQREVPLVYQVTIPPGQERALLHWVLMRNLQNAAAAMDAVKPFYARKKTIRAGVDTPVVPLLANFAPDAVAPGFEAGGARGELRALDRQLDGLGLERGEADLLVLGDENLLTGEVSASGEFEIQTRAGPRKLPLAGIAAIRGGGGIGRLPEIYLRDGQVLRGDLSGATLSLKVGKDLEVKDMSIAEIGWLLRRLDDADGKAPAGGTHYVETSRGEVIAVKAAPGDAGTLSYLSPWGEGHLPLDQIDRLAYGGAAGAKYRLWTKNGGRLTVLPGVAAVRVVPVGAKDAVDFEWRDLRTLWSTDAEGGAEPETDWLGFEDLAPRDLPAGPGFLLRGNILLPGTFVTAQLHLVTGTTVTPVKLAEVVKLAASTDDATGGAGFRLELAGGDQLQGTLRESMVEVETLGERWKIPLPLILGYQKSE